MNRYAELKRRHQAEFNTFPIKFAFSKEQFERGMAELGLLPTDTDKVYSAPGGGFYRRSDGGKFKEMLDRFDKELQEAIASDATGDGFIKEMFRCELDNHEYGYTYDCGDAIDALGYTWDDIEADPRLSRGLTEAAKEIRAYEEAKA